MGAEAWDTATLHYLSALRWRVRRLGVVAHSFNPSTREAKARGSLFEANLVYEQVPGVHRETLF